MPDFTIRVRAAFPRALAEVRTRFGRTIPLVIGGKEVETDDTLASVNPADPDEVVARLPGRHGRDEQRRGRRQGRLPAWRDTAPEKRAAVLRAPPSPRDAHRALAALRS
jgi:RHH-type proline utilization regulon transcriptional repressor/proline dehydrogenase/delta 1-pyrroline-5-carboxylate dehydrogenase